MSNEYPFHVTVRPTLAGKDKYAARPNFYGCDPYNTLAAPRLRVRVSKAGVYRVPPPWRVTGRYGK